MSAENVYIRFNITGTEQLQRVQNTLQNVDQRINKFGKNMSSVGKSLTLGLTLPIVGLIGKSVMLASDLVESSNVVNETFKGSANEVTNWAGTLNKSFGIVKLEAMQYSGAMGAMLVSSGLSTKASKDMAMGLVELTGDMSSFYNLGHEEMWTKIRSGISGETEPLKALGINMSVANLEAYALSQGINKSWKSMTQAEQVTLRYNYLMKTTSSAQGDFSRTSGGFANQLKILQGQLTNVGTSIGTILLPYFNSGIKIVNNLVKQFEGLSKANQKIVIVVGIVMAVIPPLLVIFGTLISSVVAIIGALTAVSLPVVAVVGGIGALIAIVTSFILKTYSLKEIINKLKIIISSFSEKLMILKPIIMELVKTGLSNFNIVMKQVFEVMKVAIPVIQRLINEGFEKLKIVISLVSKIIKDVYPILNSFFKQVMKEGIPIIKEIIIAVGELASAFMGNLGEGIKNIKIIWDSVFPFLKPVIIVVFDFVKNKIMNTLNIIKNVIQLFTNVIKGNWSGAWDNIKNILGLAMDNIKNKIMLGLNIIKALTVTILSAIKNYYVQKWNEIKTSTINQINTIKNKINVAFNAIKSITTSIFTAIKNKIIEIWNSVKTILSNVINWIVNKFKSGFNLAKNIIFQTLTNIKNNFTSIFETIKSTVKKAIDYIVSKITSVTSKLKGLKDLGGTIGDKIKSVGSFLNPFNKYASGTRYATGGLSLVGERGAELINLPRGSQVSTASETRDILSRKDNAKTTHELLVSGIINIKNGKQLLSLNEEQVKEIVTETLTDDITRFMR